MCFESQTQQTGSVALHVCVTSSTWCCVHALMTAVRVLHACIHGGCACAACLHSWRLCVCRSLLCRFPLHVAAVCRPHAAAGATHQGTAPFPPPLSPRPTSGDVVAVGDGQVGTKQHKFTLTGGETVLYSKFGIGATEIEVRAWRPPTRCPCSACKQASKQPASRCLCCTAAAPQSN